jgi:hypothetical protein
MELHVTRNKIKAGLKSHNIENDDGYYSLKEVITALGPRSELERQAQEAKYQRIIDEAKAAREKRRYYEENFVNLAEWNEFFAKLKVTLSEIFCRSPLTNQEKDFALRTIEGWDFERWSKERQGR